MKLDSRQKWRRRGGTTFDGRGRVGGDLNLFQRGAGEEDK
jgi:hypothetical protein